MYEDEVPETPESMELEGRDDDGRPEVLILEDHHQPGILEAALRCDHGSPVPFDPLAPSKPEWSFAGGGRPGSMDERPRPKSSGGGRLKKKPADFPLRGDEPPQRPKTSSGPRPKTPRANRPPSGGAFRQPSPARRPATADGAVAVRAAPRPGSARAEDDSPFLAGPAELVLSGVEELLRAFHEAGLEKREIAAPADVVRRFLAIHYGGERAAHAVRATMEKSMKRSEVLSYRAELFTLLYGLDRGDGVVYPSYGAACLRCLDGATRAYLVEERRRFPEMSRPPGRENRPPGARVALLSLPKPRADDAPGTVTEPCHGSVVAELLRSSNLVHVDALLTACRRSVWRGSTLGRDRPQTAGGTPRQAAGGDAAPHEQALLDLPQRTSPRIRTPRSGWSPRLHPPAVGDHWVDADRALLEVVKLVASERDHAARAERERAAADAIQKRSRAYLERNRRLRRHADAWSLLFKARQKAAKTSGYSLRLDVPALSDVLRRGLGGDRRAPEGADLVVLYQDYLAKHAALTNQKLTRNHETLKRQEAAATAQAQTLREPSLEHAQPSVCVSLQPSTDDCGEPVHTAASYRETRPPVVAPPGFATKPVTGVAIARKDAESRAAAPARPRPPGPVRTLAAPASPSRALRKVGLHFPAHLGAFAAPKPRYMDPRAKQIAAVAEASKRSARERKGSWQPGQWHQKWQPSSAPPRVQAHVLFNSELVFDPKSEHDRAAVRDRLEVTARYGGPKPPNLAHAGPPGTSHRMLARPPRTGSAPTKRRIVAENGALMVGA